MTGHNFCVLLKIHFKRLKELKEYRNFCKTSSRIRRYRVHFVRKDHEYNAGGKRTDECDCVMFSVFLLYSVHSAKNKESRPNATTRNCSDCSVINGSFLGLTQNNSLKNYSRHISHDSRHVTLDSRLFSLDSRHVTLDPRLSTITQTRAGDRNQTRSDQQR